MTRDEAFDIMRQLLRLLLGDANKLARQARNHGARREAQKRVTQIEYALEAADKAT
jgi:hypothetical protein